VNKKYQYGTFLKNYSFPFFSHLGLRLGVKSIMKQRSRLIYQILSLTTLTVLMPLFQNCGAQRPSVEISSFATTGYSHSGAETSCMACHDISRPMSGTGFLSLNTDTTFDLTRHGGSTDCITCHDSAAMNTGTRIKADWAKGYFDHYSTVTDCNSCHAVPKILPNGNAHQVVAAGAQCISCHVNNNANPPENLLAMMISKQASDYPNLSKSLWAGASPGLVIGGTVTPLNVYSPNYTALTSATNPGIFSSWTVKSQSIIKFMDHDSASFPAAMNSSCTNCHSSSAAGSFVGGMFHASVEAMRLSQPSTCVDCHGSGLPASTKGSPLPVKGTGTVAFVWSGAKTPTTTTALFNHEASVGKAECATCHAQSNWAAKSWAAGKFHTASSVPTTCGGCHAPARPPGIVSGMDHSKSGMGECAACHQASTTGVGRFTSWAGGSGSVPTGLTGGTSKLTPSATTITKTGTLVTGRTANANLTLPLYMDHSAVSTSTCSTCHSGTTNVGAKFHTNAIGTITAACTTCHSNANTAAPGKVLGWDPVGLIKSPMDHAQTGSDCKSCHGTPTAATPGLKFKDGRFHSKVATQPTTCVACHAVKLVDTKIQNGVDHTTFMDKDCVSCHTFPGTGGTTAAPKWAGGRGAPANYTIPSHTSSAKVIPGYTGVHTQTNTNCTACHGTSTDYKSIVSFDHQGLPTTSNTCLSCHMGSFADMPYIGTASKIKLQAANSTARHHPSNKFFSGANLTGLSCVGCHAVTKGAATFTNGTGGVNFPAAATNGYVKVGCGSVSGTTFACHEGNQRTMVIPTKVPVPATPAPKWQ
jgi:hypothetical protein